MVMSLTKPNQMNEILTKARKFRKQAEETTLKGILWKHFDVKPDEPYFVTGKQAKAFGFDIPEEWQLKAVKQIPSEGKGINLSQVTPSGWEIKGEDLFISPEGKQLTSKDLQALDEPTKMKTGIFKEQFPELAPFKTPEGLYDISKAINAKISGDILIKAFGEESYGKVLLASARGLVPLPTEKPLEPEGFIWDYDKGMFAPATTSMVTQREQFYQKYPEIAPPGTPGKITPEEYDIEQRVKQDEMTSLFQGIFPSHYENKSEGEYADLTAEVLTAFQDSQFVDFFAKTVQAKGRTPETERLIKLVAPGITDQQLNEFFGQPSQFEVPEVQPPTELPTEVPPQASVPQSWFDKVLGNLDKGRGGSLATPLKQAMVKVNKQKGDNLLLDFYKWYVNPIEIPPDIAKFLSRTQTAWSPAEVMKNLEPLFFAVPPLVSLRTVGMGLKELGVVTKAAEVALRGEAGFIRLGGEPSEIIKILSEMAIPKRVALAEASGLSAKVGSKAIEKLTREELSAMSEQLVKQGKLILPKAAEVTIPKAEAGMPEAGLQPSMLPEEVAAKEVFPKGKGVPTQISMEEALKLETMRAEETLYQKQMELDNLKEWIETEPTRKLLGLIKKTGKLKGEISDITIKQYKDITGKEMVPLTSLTPDKKHVYWRDALDSVVTEYGYKTTEELGQAIENTKKASDRIKALEQEIRTTAADIPLPPKPTAKQLVEQAKIPGKPMLTEAQANRTTELFGKYVDNPNTASAWELTGALRREERAIRVENLKAKAQELITQGTKPEEAMNEAIRQTMSGELPAVRTDYLSDLTDEMRQVLFTKVYHTLKEEPFEMMSTIEALTNSLMGKPIPRELGIKGGSAWARLNRVFGEQPEVMKAIEKMAEEKKPLRDVVEGIFRETGKEYPPIDEKMAEYLRSLKPVPYGETGLFDVVSDLKVVETRTAAQIELSRQQMKIEYDLAMAKLSKPSDLPPFAEWNPDTLHLYVQAGQGGLSGERARTALSFADTRTAAQKATDLERFATEIAPTVRGLSQPHYELPIEDALKVLPLWPEPAKVAVVRVLKEIGMLPIDIGGFIKAMKSSVDMSYWRQITPLIAGHVKRFALSNVDAWKALFSQKSAEGSWLRILRDSENPELYAIYDAIQKKQGRDFLRPFDLPKGTAQWKGVEEFGYLTKDRLIPRLTAKIPTIKWSNRAFITGTNSMSWGVFKDFYHAQLRVAEKYASGQLTLKVGETFDITKNMDAYATMLADWTGRASLGKLAEAGPLLGNIFYAPRYALGRIIGPRHLLSSNPYVRKEAWKDAAMFIGVIGGTVLLGRQLDFWDVETNRNSADFMKIRIGNLHIDPWGGAQQFVVFFSRVFDLMTAPITGEPAMGVSTITGAEYPLTFTNLLQNLIRSKAAPLASLIEEYMTGKTFGGEKIDIKNIKQWADRIAPMAIMDIWDAIQDKTVSVPVAGALSFVGAGVQTYTGDWNENAKKLGFPKYSDNLTYGMKDPRYTIEDWWVDTASQFTGVDPATLTEAKGFPPKVRALVETLQIRKQIKDIPNVNLTTINADSDKGDTFIQYYDKWTQRQKIVASGDKAALTVFDADVRNKDWKLGNMTQRQFVLLTDYNSLSKEEQKQFSKDHPEIDINPYQDWLRTHPKENALLAIHGQANVLTMEAYRQGVQLLKDLDYPDTAWPSTMPPEKIAQPNFDYLKAVEDFTAASSEAKLILAKDPELVKWKGLNTPDQPVRYYELQVKNRAERLYWDSLGDKEQPTTYIKDEKARRAKFLERFPRSEYFDDLSRIEALANQFPDKAIEAWVERGKLSDEFGGGSPQIKLWAFDNAFTYQLALNRRLISDKGGLSTPLERGLYTQWSVEAIKLRVKDTAESKYWESLGDKSKPETYIEDIKNRWKAFDKQFPQSDFRLDLERIEAFNKFFTPKDAELWAKRGDVAFEYGAASPEVKVFLADHSDLYTKAVKAGMLEPASDAWNIPALRLDVKWRDKDATYENINPDMKNPQTGILLRTEWLQLPENEAYRKDRRRREGYLLTNSKTGYKFPETEVETYVAYNELPIKGFRRERFLLNNQGFMDALYNAGGIADIPQPAKIPAVQYDDIYDKYPKQFDMIEGLGKPESIYFVPGGDKDLVTNRTPREQVAYNLRFKNGKLTDFGKAEIRRNGYEKFVPETFIERYVEYYTIYNEGRPKDWPKDDKGHFLTWYGDDWYLIDHPNFYNTVYATLMEYTPTDKKVKDKQLSEVPTPAVWRKYIQYLNLIEGKPRDDLRWANRDLDDWLLLTGKVTKTIVEKKRSAALTPAEKTREELKRLEELLK